MNESIHEIEETLLKWCLRRVGHYASITVETDLLNEGLLDSLMVMDLVTSIEKHFGFAIHPGEIAPRHFRSVRSLAALVASHKADLGENGNVKKL
jgi:acyl carrier protein